jgi:hypothetical protein
MIALNEREVVPTTPVWLWSIWFYYAIHKLFAGSTSALYLLAVLFSLVWHLNLALVLLLPLVVLILIWRRHLFKFTDLFKPFLLFLGLSFPLVLFEARHGFIQSQALLASLGSVGTTPVPFIPKLLHVTLYAAKNSTGLFFPFVPSGFSPYIVPVILLAVLTLAVFKKRLPRFTFFLSITWIGLYLLFFSLHPINLSEYYLNGLNILWIAAAVFTLVWITEIFKSRWVTAVLLTIFASYHLFILVSSPINHSGYFDRRALVSAIVADAGNHNYPCVAVSYMTDPGYNFGYRYLFWLQGLRVNQPQTGSPVYTIVFPHHRANRLDYTFGALGLILPDYSRYSQKQVVSSCAGPDANLTDSMFGFTN